MLPLLVMAGMAVVALGILWNGRIAVSSTRVAVGWPVKLLGFSLLAAGPIAIGVKIVMYGVESEGGVTGPARDGEIVVLWWTLLGVPAAAALVAILFARPIKDVGPPPSD